MPAYLAYFAGIVSFASACVLSIVPAYVLILTGLSIAHPAQPSRFRASASAALFLVGFAALFVASGATASGVGAWVRDRLPLFETAGAIAVGLLGLGLLAVGFIKGACDGRPGLSDAEAVALGFAAVTAGMGFSAAWTPCIGPVLAEILLYGAFPETLVEGVLLLTLFSAGLATPFLAIGIPVGSIFRRSPAAPATRALLGLALFVCALLLLTGRFARVTAYLAGFGTLLDFGI